MQSIDQLPAKNTPQIDESKNRHKASILLLEKDLCDLAVGIAKILLIVRKLGLNQNSNFLDSFSPNFVAISQGFSSDGLLWFYG